MNYPVLITQQGETIAVAYDQAGIELAVQEHYVTPDNCRVGVGVMKAVFSDGLMCDLEEVEVYPTTDKTGSTLSIAYNPSCCKGCGGLKDKS